MRYEPIPHLTKIEIENLVKENNPETVLIAVLSAALYCDDREFAKELCLELSGHPHFNVRGNAILGLGHIARIDGSLDAAKVKPIILHALEDEHDYVRGNALDAKDDIEHYAGLKI
jgi:hypothetical protein